MNSISYANYTKESRIATIYSVSAVVLIVLPLIAVICSVSCLQLPAVNLSMLRPVLIPTPIVFIGGVALLIKGRARQKKCQEWLEPYIKNLKEEIDKKQHPEEPTKEEKKAFLSFLRELIPQTESVDFRCFIYGKLAKEYPNSSITEALKEAQTNAAC